jgi:hypothetical protein
MTALPSPQLMEGEIIRSIPLSWVELAGGPSPYATLALALPVLDCE